jgi:type I restriction enzyme, S subunit
MMPSNWKLSPLKDLLEGPIKNGFSPNPAESETGYWVLGLGALGEEGIHSSEIKPVAPEEKVLKNLLETDDFLVSRSNTPDKVGRSVRFRGEVDNCSYPDLMMRFRINQNKVDKCFIEQQLKSSKVRAYFKNCAAGSSSTMVKINKGILEKAPILTPSLLEQKKIAKILSTWDQAITITEQALANSKQQKKALMQQLLTGKKRLLDKNGVKFNGEWKRFATGKLIQEVKKEKEQSPKAIELLTVKLHYKGVARTGKFPNATERGRPYFKRSTGELIIGRQNLHNGGVAIVSEECNGLIASSAISSFVARKGVDINFILSIMSTEHFRFTVDNLAGGTGQKETGVKDLLSLSLVIPGFEEQQKIAAVLSTADLQITSLQQKLDALKQEKKALMQQLLTGKRRVKVDDKKVA